MCVVILHGHGVSKQYSVLEQIQECYVFPSHGMSFIQLPVHYGVFSRIYLCAIQ